MNKQLSRSTKCGRRRSGDSASTSKRISNTKIGNQSPVIERINTDQSDLNTFDSNSAASLEDLFSFVSEHGSETDPKERVSLKRNDQIANHEEALELYSEDASVTVEAPWPTIKKTQSPVPATKPPIRKKTALNRSRSFSSSFSATNGNTPAINTEGRSSESEIGIADLAEALRILSRDVRFRSIRPLWRDPNSRPLPSDETASVEAMLREYNQVLIKAASEQKVSPALPKIAVRRPYHTTLNRWRQQERIQMENFYMADRIRNVRPSPDISREVLLKRYKQYFITPVTARSNLPSSNDVDFFTLSSAIKGRSRCSSANPVSRSSEVPTRPLTGISASGRTPSARSSICNDLPSIPTPLRPSSQNAFAVSTPHSREVLSSLDSVRRALHNHRVKEKLRRG